jgi:CheY-like chemotaxis protein/HPt (histidine-containing phosphotransfer) domain-containing protein
MGLAADAVDNGAKAVEALTRIPYDLVLMDVQMPVMNGFECTRIIRDPASAVLDHRVPVIAMTAHAQAGDRDACLEAGMNDHVGKPISVPALAEALKVWLPASEERDQSRACAGRRFGDEEDTAVWDREAFMERIMGDEDLERDIIGGFRLDAENRLVIMRQTLAQGNLNLLASQAHSIKGAAANLGAHRLRNAARALESVAGSGHGEACRDGFCALERALSDFFDEIGRRHARPLP